MPTTAIPALRHVRSDGPYNATTFTEQNQAIVGKSARLRGFGVVSFTPNVSITLEPGAFISVGLALNPSEPDRISGIIAETTANSVISAVGYTNDFYIFAIANSVSEVTDSIFTVAASPAPIGTQYAPIARYIAGEFILEDAIGSDSLEGQVVKARTDSGADQFYLTPEVGPTPRAVTITGAVLPDGSSYAGVTGFTGSPAFSVGSSNYIWYRHSLGTIENNTTGFLTDSDTLPLWVLDLDGSGNVTGKTDSRCWFGGGGGTGDASSIFERLKEPLQHGVMGDAQISTLPTVALPHIDAGSSTGTFISPSAYELSPGEVLQSGFTVAHSQAPDPVNQVVAVVLTDRIVLPAEIQIEVSRNITGGTTLPPINFETMSNFANHVFTTPPVGSDDNILNIKITNVGATAFEVQGWGLYFNQIGGALGLVVDGPGIFTSSTGLVVGNQKPNWSWIHPLSTGATMFTWNSGASTLSWDSSFQFEYAIDGTYQENTVLVGSSPLTGISVGDYVYADLDRLGVNVTLQRQAGKPTPITDRVIFARRIGAELHLQDSTILISGMPALYPKLGLSRGVYQGLQIANAPGPANAVATMADLASVGGGSARILSMFNEFAGSGVDGNVTLSGVASLNLTNKQYNTLTLSGTAGISLTSSITYFGVKGLLTLNPGAILSAIGVGNAGGAGGAPVAAPSVGNPGSSGVGVSRFSNGNSTGAGGGGGCRDTSFNAGGIGGNGGGVFGTAGGAGGASVNPPNPAPLAGVGTGSETLQPFWWQTLQPHAAGVGGGGGGSGAANAAFTVSPPGGAGGYGGGIIWIECGSLDFQAGSLITANGANGSNGGDATPYTNGPGGGGGGGSGGMIMVHTKNIVSSAGTLTANGGVGGSGGTSLWGGYGAPGATGGIGRVIIVLV